MPEFRLKIEQSYTTHRTAYVTVEADTLEDAIELQSEAEDPDDNAGWIEQETNLSSEVSEAGEDEPDPSELHERDTFVPAPPPLEDQFSQFVGDRGGLIDGEAG
jgi:hypothetical protein